MTTLTADDDAAGHRGLRVAMALYADVTFDSRVLREASALASRGHSVTIYCLAGTPGRDAQVAVVAQVPPGAVVLPDGSSPFLKSSSPSRLGRLVARARWAIGYARTVRAWGRMVVEAAGDVDVWHAHDLTGLMAVSPFLPRSSRLVYDSHEIFLETGTASRLPGPARRLLRAYERHLVKRASSLITVNDGYARILRRRVRPREVVIVRNCPPRWSPQRGDSPRLRVEAGIPAGAPVALYHGALSPNRGIEEFAAALLEPGMDGVYGVLLGFGPLLHTLQDQAQDPAFGGRLRVLAAVPPGELLDWIAGADVGVIALQPSTLNHWLCTPNKMWEALAVGVPVVVSDFPEMRRVVLEDLERPLGRTCDPTSPASIALAIRSIAEAPEQERARLRERCLQAAHQRWNWETEALGLTGLYDRLV